MVAVAMNTPGFDESAHGQDFCGGGNEEQVAWESDRLRGRLAREVLSAFSHNTFGQGGGAAKTTFVIGATGMLQLISFCACGFGWFVRLTTSSGLFPQQSSREQTE